MIPAQLDTIVCKKLSEIHSCDVHIHADNAIGGGCINNALKLKTNVGTYFLKWNDAAQFPGMFHSEAKGLNLLRDSNSVYVPEVILADEAGGYSFLLLEYIDAGAMNNNYWENFGSRLAELHRVSATNFGLDHDNYIGSLKQGNHQHPTWKEFFINERIIPQLTLANLDSRLTGKFDNLFEKLDDIFPNEPPALLHGDLWSGNYMVSATGDPVIMDTAVYFGHREMDLAMSKLFGGFDSRFYISYNKAFQLEKGWESRMDICNLYPLLVHVNLFGGSYLAQIESILRRF